jgi:hypothetical protein
MSSPEIGRCTAFAIGGFQLIANLVLLFRGLARLPQELAKEGATARIADLIRTTWVYGMFGNLCVSVVLLLVAPGLNTAEPVARQVAGVIGIYYVLVGFAIYWFAQARHAGMLLFSLLGFALLATLWFSR